IRSRIGWVPSVDRSFYLRVSGLENLLFFARMYGVTKSRARRRAVELLDAVGLSDHGSKRAGLYSHGMLKRLAVARALISEPDVLLLDEATHDLDPLGSAEIRSLVSNIASQGGAIVWATQRLAELRDFADRVTVLQDGLTRFAGSVPELISRAALRSFRLRFANPLSVGGASMPPGMEFESLAADDSVLLHLSAEVSLGEALDHIRQQGLVLVSCTEATSEVETAFLELTTKEGAR
ncbi:MAG TPA: ABC transporter ATP-binding protein, partial [Acidimicrobiia bacterium]|nr:ABC transporter ATP-binding protein [Acidimicrobiia bacterium]